MSKEIKEEGGRKETGRNGATARSEAVKIKVERIECKKKLLQRTAEGVFASAAREAGTI